MEVLGVKNRDVFFTLIGNQLTRYTLVNNKFHSESFGQFPIASPQKMLGTKEDQLLTFETAGGYSYLKIWSLSRESINLKNTFKYEGSHRDVELHERNILTFIMVRRDQFSYLFVDTEGLKEVLRINEPSSYGSPLVEHKIRFLDENTFAVSQRVNRYDFEIQIYSGQNWDQIKFVNSLRDLAIPAMAIFDRDHIVFYGNATGGQVRIGSVRSAFPTFSVFPRQTEYFWDWTDTLESAAGGFLAISRNGFAIHSPWKKILETNSLTL